ncbi:MAG TPA: hypothetical protein VGV88_15235 [Candidatus Dormibacteraeota bacterium]|nr:hypothetical protein [Candidatus Dormibacteraeota bacterium]
MRRYVVLAALFVLTACNQSSAAAIGAADVAVQSSDVPKGVQKCSASGDIDSFLNSVKTKDPTTYSSTKSEWDKAKSNGATAAEVVFYTDSKAHCDSITNNSQNGDLATATYPIVINFVIQFKDQASAEKGYTTESIFGFSSGTISSTAAAGVTKGTATGLGANSITLLIAIGNQSFFVAVWQNKTFMVILAVINIDTGQAKKIATNENGRIK